MTMRTSARTVSGGSDSKVLHVQALNQLLVNSHLQLLELRAALRTQRRSPASLLRSIDGIDLDGGGADGRGCGRDAIGPFRH